MTLDQMLDEAVAHREWIRLDWYPGLDADNLHRLWYARQCALKAAGAAEGLTEAEVRSRYEARWNAVVDGRKSS